MQKQKTSRTVALCLISIMLGMSNLSYSLEQVPLPLPSQGCSFSGSFTQSKDVEGFVGPLLSAGVFFYHCEAGVIWKTKAPVSQTFVFRKSGKAYSLQQQKVKALKSAQGKTLGRLLNSLIGGDQDQISAQFEITTRPEIECQEGSDTCEPSAEVYILEPRKRSLKRGLKVIELDLAQTKKAEGTEPSMSIGISMLDRKDQWTRIISSKVENVESLMNSDLLCSDVVTLSKQECALLHDAS